MWQQWRCLLHLLFSVTDDIYSFVCHTFLPRLLSSYMERKTSSLMCFYSFLMVNNSTVFSKLTKLCNLYHNPVLEHLFPSHQKRSLMPICSHSLFSCSASATTNLLSVSIDLSFLDISCNPNDKICGLFHLAFFFTHRNVFEIHVCSSRNHSTLFFFIAELFNFMDIPNFCYLFALSWTFGLFLV